MVHTTDWFPGRVSNTYRDNYQAIFTVEPLCGGDCNIGCEGGEANCPVKLRLRCNPEDCETCTELCKYDTHKRRAL
ncbi:hypothetical protein LCGC14_0614730 [marine sediment metagenome]|uniref:Uncharacterized protein n=1 Tax=marine sediment metagenome TaxID=412755 RepID=A0A0F9UF41_9ZZZZ